MLSGISFTKIIFSGTMYHGMDDLHNSSREASFGRDYGLLMLNDLFEGLLSRTVIIVDENNKVTYTDQVAEISEEPDYDAAIAAL